MTPRATFIAVWDDAVQHCSDRPFLVFEDNSGRVYDWTYREWAEVCDRVAAHLIAAKVAPEDRVHVALANSPAFLAFWFACLRLGAVLVPSDPRATAPELAVHVAIAQPRITVLGRRAAALPACDRPIWRVDEDDAELTAWSRSARLAVAEPAPDSPAAILFTSGTTSTPKGVVVTQANYVFAGTVMASAASMTPDDRALVVLPLFHANAQYYSIAPAVSTGATVCLMRGFSASGFVGQAIRHRATHASVFAAPIRMVLARSNPASARAAVRHCWYAQNVSVEQHAAFGSLVGCRPRQLYGMTETIAAVTCESANAETTGTIGRVTAGCDVDLRDPNGDDSVALGAIGEITVGGTRGLTLFKEYWNAPDVTDAAFRDQRFRTGDLASADPSGRLTFRGRRGDVLKVSGENVSTVEVEAALDAHSGVLEAAVLGRADPIRDEVPVAYVVRSAAGADLTRAQLLAFCEDRLAPSKMPRDIVFVDELPRTSVGKIRKFLLTG